MGPDLLGFSFPQYTGGCGGLSRQQRRTAIAALSLQLNAEAVATSGDQKEGKVCPTNCRCFYDSTVDFNGHKPQRMGATETALQS